jgi:hypothetical protein
MERLILAFLAVLVMAFLGNILYNESFKDAPFEIFKDEETNRQFFRRNKAPKADALAAAAAANPSLPTPPPTDYEEPGTILIEEVDLYPPYYPDIKDLGKGKKDSKKTPSTVQGTTYKSGIRSRSS